MAHFDCRVGVFDSARQAEGLVLWRAAELRLHARDHSIIWSFELESIRQNPGLQCQLGVGCHKVLRRTFCGSRVQHHPEAVGNSGLTPRENIPPACLAHVQVLPSRALWASHAETSGLWFSHRTA